MKTNLHARGYLLTSRLGVRPGFSPGTYVELYQGDASDGRAHDRLVQRAVPRLDATENARSTRPLEAADSASPTRAASPTRCEMQSDGRSATH